MVSDQSHACSDGGACSTDCRFHLLWKWSVHEDFCAPLLIVSANDAMVSRRFRQHEVHGPCLSAHAPFPPKHSRLYTCSPTAGIGQAKIEHIIFYLQGLANSRSLSMSLIILSSFDTRLKCALPGTEGGCIFLEYSSSLDTSE